MDNENIELMKEKLAKVELEGFTLGTNLLEEDLLIIQENLEIPKEIKILGFLDDSIMKSKKKGLAITNDGLYWNITGAKADGKHKDKGALTSAELQKFIFTIKKKGEIIIFENSELKSTKSKNIMIKLSLSNNLFEEAISEFLRNSTLKDQSYEIKKIENYLKWDDNNDLDDNETLIWYKKSFSAYENNDGNFKLNWSKNFYIPGSLVLFHRKLYKEAAISFIIFIISLFLFSFGAPISGPVLVIYILLMSVLNPFLVYKRYKRVEQLIESKEDEEVKKLQVYEIMGGVNTFSKVILGASAVLVIIWFILGIKLALIGAGLFITYSVIAYILKKNKGSDEKAYAKAVEKAEL